MPVHFAEPPQASVEGLQAVLPRLAGRVSLSAHAPEINTAASQLLRAGDLSTAAAPARAGVVSAPVHILGLDQIVGKKALSAAPIRLWTHLLPGTGEAPQVLADVDAKTNRFAAITEGDQVSSLGRQIRKAESEGRASNKEYDLAVIRVPALHLSAMWLKGRKGEPDVIVPNESPASPLSAGKHYSVEEFLAALRPAAEAQLRETDSEKGG